MFTRYDTEIDTRAISRLRDQISQDIDSGSYDGAVIALAHRGELVSHEAIGYAHRDSGRDAQTSDVFRILSITKAFTTNLVFQAIEEGKLAFSTKVVDVIPEFRSADRFLNKRKDRISVTDLLTHRSSLPPTPEPLPMQELGNLENLIAHICTTDAVGEPGRAIEYSPLFNHALLGEMLRRVFGASSYRELVQSRIFDPLEMRSSAIGAADRLKDRIVPLKARFDDAGWLSAADIESLNDGLTADAEMPWVGGVSTAGDMLRFAEMLRRGGELNGVRLVSPGIIERATQNLTGNEPNNWWIPMAQRRNWDLMPANLGLGFFLRGTGMHPSILGSLTSPRTFGNYGAGSTLFWVDPERELSFVALTSGVLEESQNIVRFQTLSDIAVSSVVRRVTDPALPQLD